MMFRHTAVALLGALLACLAVPVWANGQDGPAGTYVLEPTPSEHWRDGRLSTHTRRAGVTLADAHIIRIPLPDGRTVTARRTRAEALEGDGLLWSGRVGATPAAFVHLVQRGLVLVGTVETGAGTYAIEYAGPDAQRVVEVLTTRGRCGGGRVAAAPLVSTESRSVAPTASLSPATGVVVDLLVVYTPDARVSAGGEEPMRATVDLAVAATNDALANSLVPARVRLVGAREVAYAESSSLALDLDRLTATRDGVMDDVHVWRDVLGADLVSLVVERNSAGLEGMAWLMQQPAVTFESLAFSVVMRRTAVALTLAHEIGHNVGLSHDRANAGSPGAHSFAYGFRDPPYLRDVMAYACSGAPCPLIPYFSNPSVLYNGRPTGRANTEDNARALTLTMPVAAQFRVRSGPELTQVSPSVVPTLGDVRVTLQGIRLSTVVRVLVRGRDATALVVTSPDTLSVLVPRQPQGRADIVVEDDAGEQSLLASALQYVPSAADADGDALDDAWERVMGLSPVSAIGNDGPDGDPDGDGVSNLAERETHGHPRGFYRRYLAEGAAGDFFSTQIALLNPSTTALGAVVRYLRGDGTVRSSWLGVPGMTRRTLSPAAIAQASPGEFSVVIESNAPLVADRTMSWDGSGYGAHAETSLGAPSLRWFLAEGATLGGFNLFYLMQNPNSVAAQVRVRFLRAAGPPLERVYTLPPISRTNVWVNQETFGHLGLALASAEVSAGIEVLNGQPIVVERAMYLDRPGQPFAAGHESVGALAPQSEWYLAEGATGSWFDLFVLVVNPQTTPAVLEVSYLLPTGAVIRKPHIVPALSRYTIWVDHEDARLADTAVATRVLATNGVPVVVERAMWWPAGSTTWNEGHNVVAAPAPSARWAVAEGEVGGERGAETYLLVANTSPSPGEVTVTLLFEDGDTAVRAFVAPGEGRLNVDVGAEFAEARGRRFAAIVNSSPDSPLALVVERAMYWSANGVRWSAGTAALGSPLP